MPSIKSIRRRKASVSTTKKIMKAMNMVAVSKLQKVRGRIGAARSLYGGLREAICSVNAAESDRGHRFLSEGSGGGTLYVVFTGDRGLCGGYNVSVSQAAADHMEGKPGVTVLAVGLKGGEYLSQRGWPVAKRYPGVMDTAFFEDAEIIGRLVVETFANGGAREAYAAYTRFESALSYVPTVIRILPLEAGAGGHDPLGMGYDPGVGPFLDHAVPQYVNSLIYYAMLESSACEQASRMFCMEGAVDNATEIIGGLQRAYNRKRQAGITQEISEIVGGTDASGAGRRKAAPRKGRAVRGARGGRA